MAALSLLQRHASIFSPFRPRSRYNECLALTLSARKLQNPSALSYVLMQQSRALTPAAAATTAAAPRAAAPRTAAAAAVITSPTSAAAVSSLPGAATTDLQHYLRNGGEGDGIRLYRQLLQQAKEQYERRRAEVDAELLPLLQQEKVVLFLEGTVDNPCSLASLNVVRMLQQLQTLPFVSIDVFSHPTLLGFAATRCIAGSRPPLLFINGQCIGSHDKLLQLYRRDQLYPLLARSLGLAARLQQQLLPIALY